MKRRWFIRSFFICLLLLCMAGWAWGHTHEDHLELQFRGQALACISGKGEVFVSLAKRGTSSYISYGNGPVSNWDLVPFYTLMHRHYFGGFFAGKYPSGYGIAGEYVGLPYWFVTGVLALTAVYVWRKTRPKLNSARAFPVEITKPQIK